jgi:DNA-3-methyladenine glycosylase I
MSDLTVGLAGAKPPPPPISPDDGYDVAGVAGDRRPRCAWGASTLDYAAYHDREWGRATADERTLFEKLCLEGFQAGLSWLTILRKRPAFRQGFANFDAGLVASFDEDDVYRLLGDAGIVRHRRKIEAAIGNARALVQMWEQGESLAGLIWSYEPAPSPAAGSMADLAPQTAASTALSKALKQRGFSFVGPTTVYAAMQAMGVVNDHLAGCWARDGCEASRAVLQRPPAAKTRLGA